MKPGEGEISQIVHIKIVYQKMLIVIDYAKKLEIKKKKKMIKLVCSYLK